MTDVRPLPQTTFDDRLADVLAAAPDPRAGLFGPGSVVWKVARHTPVYLVSTPMSGFMHAAHPWIAHGVAEHSSLFSDPRKRAQYTYLMLMQIVFGDLETVRRTSRALHGMHSKVEGELPVDSGRFPAGSSYSANEENALLWVHLVFFWSRLRMYQLVVGRLSAAELEQYVAESRRFAACFGIPDDLLPSSYAEFVATVDGIAASDAIATTPASEATVDFLMGLVPRVGRPAFTGFLVETIQDPLRVALKLPAPSATTRGWQQLVVLGLRAFRLLAPTALKYVPAYLEAQERLTGRRQPGLSRRFSGVIVGRERSVA